MTYFNSWGRVFRPARVIFALFAASVTVGAQVSYDRLRQADREPQNWFTYSGSYASQRHSLCDWS